MTATASEPAPGLRERKKRATRVALGRAALRLARVHGWDKVTVEAIAAEADVSVRTFFNYFSSKEEAVMADTEDRTARVVALLRARPADEPVLESLRVALLEGLEIGADDRNDWLEQFRLTKRTPSLLPHLIAQQEEAERDLAAAVAERTGTRADDLYPALVVASVIAVVKTAIRCWSEDQESARLETLITTSLRHLAEGLRPPGPDA